MPYNHMQAMSRIQRATKAARARTRGHYHMLGVRAESGRFQVVRHDRRGGMLEPIPMSDWTDLQGALDYLDSLT